MTTAPAPSCCICHSPLWDDEAGRYACRPCERSIDNDLRAIAGPGGLFARLCLRIHPSRGSSGPAVSGTPSASMPPNEEILNLTSNGGIANDLETWVKDWASYGLAHIGAGVRPQYRIGQAVATLRLNLPQAVIRHPAIDEFAREIYKLRCFLQGKITGEPAPRGIDAPCPCGVVIRYTLNAVARTCRGCTTEYGHGQLIQLTLAAKEAA